MNVRPVQSDDNGALIQLIAQFRSTLTQFRGGQWTQDIEAAERELGQYHVLGNPIFVAENEKDEIVGYLVCRIQDDIVWAESLFVSPDFRRMGYASALYGKAEELARQKGNEPVYNWVHPNNDRMIAFLKKRGYGVLNLVELRRTRPGEQPAERITVGKHTFDY